MAAAISCNFELEPATAAAGELQSFLPNSPEVTWCLRHSPRDIVYPDRTAQFSALPEDYDLSVDDKNLQRHTLVRLVCPEQCQIMVARLNGGGQTPAEELMHGPPSGGFWAAPIDRIPRSPASQDRYRKMCPSLLNLEGGCARGTQRIRLRWEKRMDQLWVA